MKRGTKPKPTARRKLEGNPGRRPFNDREPQLPPVETPPPDELEDDARATAEWRRVLLLLQRACVVTEGDRAALIALCQQWSLYLDAHKKVSAAGLVVKSQSGYPMPNPYLAIAKRALATCERLWSEFGLTPSSRTRVAAAPGTSGGADDAFSEFDEPPSSTKSTH